MLAIRSEGLNFLSVLAVFFICIGCDTGWTLPQIPNDQFQPNIFIQQEPTEFNHPTGINRDYPPPSINQAPVQENSNERPIYDDHPIEEDLNNNRPRGRPYSGSFAEELETVVGDESEKSIPGSPEQDYPVFEEIPRTSFSCHDKPVPAYYADVEARCQVFHICDVGGHKHSFLCPNGSVFNQKYLVCDWWYDFACENAENLFSKQLVSTETTPFTTDVINGGQTFTHDGGLAYQNQPTQQDNFNINLNPVAIDHGFNTGFTQTQLDTPQQVYTNSYYVPQNDIFHGAETGFPGRDLINGGNVDNAQANRNDIVNGENISSVYNNNNNINNNNNENQNLTNNNNYNTQHVGKVSGDTHNVENRNVNRGEHEKSYIEEQNFKPSHEFHESKNQNSFLNNKDETNNGRRKQVKINRRGHDNSQSKSTTPSSINSYTKENVDQFSIQEQNVYVPPALKNKNTGEGLKNIANNTGVRQENESFHNYNDQHIQRTESINNNDFNPNNLQPTPINSNNNNFNSPNIQFQPPITQGANKFQSNVNNNFNPANTQFQPLNINREATSNYQPNQFRPDTVQ